MLEGKTLNPLDLSLKPNLLGKFNNLYLLLISISDYGRKSNNIVS